MSIPLPSPPGRDLTAFHELVVDLLQRAVPPPEGLPYLRELMNRAEVVPSRWEGVALQILLARHHAHAPGGEGLGAALDVLQNALAEARALEDRSLTVRILSFMGNALHKQGQYAQALNAFAECAQIASGIEDPYVQFLVMNNMAVFHLTNGSHLEGLELLEQAQEAARASGNALGEQITLLNQLVALNRLGRYDRTLELTAVLDAGPDLPTAYRLAQLTQQVAALNGLSREPEALAWAEVALRLAEEFGNSERLGEVKAELAHTLQRLGRFQEALAYAQAAQGQLDSERSPEVVLENGRRLWELHEALGQTADALRCLKQYQAAEAERLTRMLSARSSAFAVHTRVSALEAQATVERRKNAELGKLIAELHRAEDALKYQSTHDALTGLRNRVSFCQRAQVLLNTLPPHHQAAMIFIDLDNFKGVNDLYGHAAGDDLLLQVAQRLTSVCPEGLAGRIGGDEFVLLLPVADAGEAWAQATEMLRLLSQPFQLSTGDRVETSGSAGVALAPRDGQEADVLQHRADQAMYASKRRVSGEVQFYSLEIGAAREARLRLESDLRWAVRSAELRLHYQAKYDVPGQNLQGFEALVRWERPGVGLVGPQTFIPVAEQSQCMLSIGGWVLEEACRQAVRWNLAARKLSMAVNVSVMQFQQPDFVQVVRDVLARTGCAPQVLTIELTETVILKDLEHARTRIEALQQLGVQVTMDDFGTGYSSLSVLRNLPLNFLKIDRSFMQGIRQPQPAGTKAEVMLATIVDLAHQLDMQVTAEGVETGAQLEFLKAVGCDHVQGFLLGKPEAAEQAAARLEQIGGH